jgi:hypothetical protein
MSRAPALAPVSAPGATIRGNSHEAATARRRQHHRRDRHECDYVERALLLWPRLERAKLRRMADDPRRIAELVVRRTSQPYDAILAMLTRQNPALAPRPDEPAGFEVATAKPGVTLRVVRSEEGSEIRVTSVVPFQNL